MHALRLATDAAVLADELTLGLPVRGIRDQLTRAMDSVVLNIAEGRGYRGALARKHFRIAHGSCQEVKAAVELLRRTQRLEAVAGQRLWAMLDEVGAMTWALAGR